VERLTARTKLTRKQAERVGARQCDGILLPGVELLFDDGDLAGSTVRDVLADPARYEGATLADSLEGPDCGSCKVMIMRRPDGTPWIHSFAHGRTACELRYDRQSVEAALKNLPASEIPDVFVQLAVVRDLSEDETHELTTKAAALAGVNKASWQPG
jgi:hypothetical protein